jgi:hypothetical protein
VGGADDGRCTLPTGEGVAGACRCTTIASCLARVPHVVVLGLQIMTLNSSGDSYSVFRDRKLESGKMGF